MSNKQTAYSGKVDTAALSEADVSLMERLVAAGQAHLFEAWDEVGRHEERKRAMLDQLKMVDLTYPGGITCFIRKARQLLSEGSIPAGMDAGVSLSQPDTADLTQLDAKYRRAEALGLEVVSNAAFVLVAGGLGERLGYDGIKMEIPVELTTLTTYLGLYCRTIAAIEKRANQNKSERSQILFLIMTSEGTCDRLKAHLHENDYFGLSPDQVRVFEQRLVPSLSDTDARLATQGPYDLLLKPGGHGDVHAMLHLLGLAKQLADEGRSHIIFIQDTNALIVNLILAALGEAVTRQFDFTFVCAPRVPQEPIGAVVRLVGADNERTVNVEYNQLEGFLKTQGGEGDRATRSGYSVYPGNINVLITRIEPYVETLERTQGTVPGFINPKYADETETKFAKPTRVETLMQDIAALYPQESRIGVTLFDRHWSLAAMKNNIALATSLAQRGQPDYSAGAAESGYYHCQRIRLRMAGATIEPSEQIVYQGIPFRDGARVVLSPSFSLLLEDAVGRLVNVRLSRQATLVLDGRNIELHDVNLEGTAALVIRACEGAHVRVQGLAISQPGYSFRPLGADEYEDGHVPAFLRIRGYERVDQCPFIYTITTPGEYVIGADGQCKEK